MTWEEACRILGVHPDATPQEIKEAYDYKQWTLHPDVRSKMPERPRKKADQEIVKVNEAYNFLSDPKNRKPKLEVQPDRITFRNVAPGETRTDHFEFRGDPDPQPDVSPAHWSWGTIPRVHSLTQSSKYPVAVEIEAVGQDWGRNYQQDIAIRLGDEEARVTIELQMKPEPPKAKAPFSGTPWTTASHPPPRPPTSRRRRTPTWAKWAIALAAITLVVIVVTGLSWAFANPNQDAITGTWRHGLPDEVPPGANIDPRALDMLRENLPKSETQLHFLEFSKDGRLLCTSQGLVVDGEYTFVDTDHVEFVWAVPDGPPGLVLYSTVYRVSFSDDLNKMGLRREGFSRTYAREN
ncbi:MAG: J domain-containing protein [Chloroflexi bacterium]|nr:J domain-containing protein [Chloroflexota bacterium]